MLPRRSASTPRCVELLARRNAFGVLSDDIHPESSALFGRHAADLSMAGSVQAAMRQSTRCEDV
jgi:hypothetical protein